MNLFRSTFTVGGMTMVSRVLGFGRDILVANFLGTGLVADAWVVAFRFPNLFRRIFAEGAFNSAFIPLYSKRLEGEGPAAAKSFAEEAQAGLGSVLIVFTLIMLALMPWAMLFLAPGFLFSEAEAFSFSEAVAKVMHGDTPEKYDLTVLFTRITLPYLFFVSIVALLSGILNSLGRFMVAAAAPVLLNIILILALLGFGVLDLFPTAGHALVWGVFLAGAAQMAALVWGCRRIGVMPSIHLPLWTPRVRRLVVLGVPGIIAAGITQINLLIGTMIATFQDQAASILYYADRIYQLPLGIIGVAMGVVLLPELSRRLRAGDEGGALESQNRAIELSMLLTIPAAVALMIIPLPIIVTLFERGEFLRADAIGVANALLAFSAGLPAFVLIKVFQPGFFAREDTATPMWFAGAQTIVNVTLSLILFRQIGFVGIAIATSVGAWVNAILLGWRLHALDIYRPDARLLSRGLRILAASAGMGFALWAGRLWLGGTVDGAFWVQIAGLAALVGGGGLIYGALALLTKAASLSDVIDVSTHRRDDG